MTKRIDCCFDDYNFVDMPPLKAFDDPHWLEMHSPTLLQQCDNCGKWFNHLGMFGDDLCDDCELLWPN